MGITPNFPSRLPNIWPRARAIAFLKPVKDLNEAKSYRQITLLCHLYKLLERLILNSLGPIIELHLIPEQAGFRPKILCTSHILNLVQYIENGLEKNQPTVDLTATYDTAPPNH